MKFDTLKNILLILLLLNGCQYTSGNQRPSILKKGETIHSFISTEKADTFYVSMQADEFASINVVEITTRVHARVYDPEGNLIQWVDENRMEGEVVSVFSKSSGMYKIVVAWNFSPPFSGKYSIQLRKHEKAGSTVYDRIRQLFDSNYENGSPGGALLVTKNSTPVLKLFKGLANMESQLRIDEHSEFELASCSKQFTAFAVAKLIESGKLKPDSEIHSFLPELPSLGYEITIANLLNHTSGIRNTDDQKYAGLGHQDITTLSTCLNFAFSQKKLLFRPGERYSYSNTNYNLLAEIVSRVTGEPFAEWCRREIFLPLGMKSTWIKTEIGQYSARTVHSYSLAESGLLEVRNNWAATGASGLQTSLNDIEKWISAMEKLSATNPKLHATLNTISNLSNGDPVYYAFGNQFNLVHKKNEISHLGLVLGYRTAIARYPDEKLAIAYLSNDGNDATYQRFYRIRDMLLGIEYSNLPDLAKIPDVKEVVEADKKDRTYDESVDVSPYAGIYFSEELGTTWKLIVENNRLIIRHQRMSPIILKSSGKDLFGFIRFDRDTKGGIKGLTILENGIEFKKAD
jgi:CubicO group peptidase (beta-lactamase class C family)